MHVCFSSTEQREHVTTYKQHRLLSLDLLLFPMLLLLLLTLPLPAFLLFFFATSLLQLLQLHLCLALHIVDLLHAAA